MPQLSPKISQTSGAFARPRADQVAAAGVTCGSAVPRSRSGRTTRPAGLLQFRLVSVRVGGLPLRLGGRIIRPRRRPEIDVCFPVQLDRPSLLNPW